MKPLDLRECRQCGQPYQPQHYLSRYCHPTCKARADSARKLGRGARAEGQRAVRALLCSRWGRRA